MAAGIKVVGKRPAEVQQRLLFNPQCSRASSLKSHFGECITYKTCSDSSQRVISLQPKVLSFDFQFSKGNSVNTLTRTDGFAGVAANNM
jgi:hypothetical protein